MDFCKTWGKLRQLQCPSNAPFSQNCALEFIVMTHQRILRKSKSTSISMSAGKSRSPKSAAGTLSRVETEDIEEIPQPTAYDRLPAVTATFPAVFKELEVEQRY
jgi:hypothetical protein